MGGLLSQSTGYVIPAAFILLLVGGISAVERGKILIFGGNGLIGGAVTEALVRAGYDVTITNRGTWYWDTDKTIKPFVQHIHCDRYSVFMMASSISRECPDLVEFVESVDKFQAVIDFSAYEVAVISQALDVLAGKVGVYIYISSDSVYEVCDKHHDNPTREADAVRPGDNARREQLAQADDYGDKKFRCEEELVKAHLRGGPAYIFLRLPDVIGPRDNTDRWWLYQLWVKLAPHFDKPVTCPAWLEHKKLSFVFSEDVGDAVVKILQQGDTSILYNKAYNLAFEEHITLPELLTEIGQLIGVGKLQMKIDPKDAKEEGYYLFPSVKKGPIDISFAKKTFGFSPTPIKKALKVSADFYESAVLNARFAHYKKRVVGKLAKDVFPDSNRAKVNAVLAQAYSDKDMKDEL